MVQVDTRTPMDEQVVRLYRVGERALAGKAPAWFGLETRARSARDLVEGWVRAGLPHGDIGDGIVQGAVRLQDTFLDEVTRLDEEMSAGLAGTVVAIGAGLSEGLARGVGRRVMPKDLEAMSTVTRVCEGVPAAAGRYNLGEDPQRVLREASAIVTHGLNSPSITADAELGAAGIIENGSIYGMSKGFMAAMLSQYHPEPIKVRHADVGVPDQEGVQSAFSL